MSGGKVLFRLELTNSGRYRALSDEDSLCAEAYQVSQLRERMEQAVRERFGEPRPISLLVGNPPS